MTEKQESPSAGAKSKPRCDFCGKELGDEDFPSISGGGYCVKCDPYPDEEA